MALLSWVQNKVNRRHEKKRSDGNTSSAHRTSMPSTRKEEFDDCPQVLLTIGTFGNDKLKENPQSHNPSETSHSSQDLHDFSLEEVVKLKKELTKLLTRKPKSSSSGPEKGGAGANQPLNRFLNCPSSLEVDRTCTLTLSNDLDDGEDGNLSPNSKIILNKARDILADRRNALRQRSISFLLKKMFVCRSGFVPTPSLRDPLMESRMEKLLRIILHKKIYPQNSASVSSRKFLEKKPMDGTTAGDELREKGEGSKWVKTDSECRLMIQIACIDIAQSKRSDTYVKETVAASASPGVGEIQSTPLWKSFQELDEVNFYSKKKPISASKAVVTIERCDLQ